MLVILRIVPGRNLRFAAVFLVFCSARARAADADPAALAYQRALTSYSSGDVVGALASMRESYRLSARSELLYNIALLEDERGNCSASLAAYRQYLERVPQGQYRETAIQASAELGARCEPSAEAAAPSTKVERGAEPAETPASAAPPARPPSSGPGLAPEPLATVPPVDPSSAPSSPVSLSPGHWLGWSALAAGGVAGVGAIYFTFSALDARSRFESSLQIEASGGAYADFGLQDEQHLSTRWARALAVTSGALIGGGVLVLVLSRRTPSSAGVTAGLWMAPSRVAAQVSAGF